MFRPQMILHVPPVDLLIALVVTVTRFFTHVHTAGGIGRYWSLCFGVYVVEVAGRFPINANARSVMALIRKHRIYFQKLELR